MAQDKLLEIEIVTPQEKVFTGMGSSVSLPGSLSSFQVLYNHAPIVSTLDPGITKVLDESGNKFIFASGPGFAEVRQNKVSVLVENAFNVTDIDISTEKKELEETKRTLEKAKSSEDKELINKKIKEIKNKIKAAETL